jgi:hypothetical protein
MNFFSLSIRKYSLGVLGVYGGTLLHPHIVQNPKLD